MTESFFQIDRQDVARARQVVSVVADPKLCRQLLTAGGREGENPRSAAKFDWIDAERGVDATSLRRVADALKQFTAPTAILGVPRVSPLPVKEVERHRVSAAIIREVFDRLGRHRVSEVVLNSAILMFTADVSTVRRDCVDMQLLTRSADGSEYSLVVETG